MENTCTFPAMATSRRRSYLRTSQFLIYLVMALNLSGTVAQKYVEPYGDNVCTRITSVTNVQRIPMSGTQTKRFRYMTKCSVFGVAMCSRYRIVYVNAYRELVSTQYAVRPGCCAGYVQQDTMCIEAPPTTSPPRTARTTVQSNTVRAPFSGLGPRGSAGGYPIKDGAKGQAGHPDGGLLDQEGGYFEVNPDYKGPEVDKVLPLIASGVAGIITLTAVIAFILIVISRRKRKRNKVQPGFHDSVRFRTNPQMKPTSKLEMKHVQAEKKPVQALAAVSTKTTPKIAKKSKKLSRRDGPYVEIEDIPGTPFAGVSAKAEALLQDDLKTKVHVANIHHRRSLNDSQRLKKSPVKRGGSMRCVPQYAVVNKLRKPDQDCEELLDNRKQKQKNNNDLDSLHGAYHAFTLDDQDTAPVYADPNQKAYDKCKSSTWACRVGASLKDSKPRGMGTLTPGTVLALVKQSNLRESSKLFTSCGGGGAHRLSNEFINKDDDSENSSGYSSLRHSVEGEPDNMYGKLNHATTVKPAQNDSKNQTGAIDTSDQNDYDKLRRGPKSRTLGTKWATSGHYETLDVNEHES